jgi:hypothetical protein
MQLQSGSPMTYSRAGRAEIILASGPVVLFDQ